VAAERKRERDHSRIRGRCGRGIRSELPPAWAIERKRRGSSKMVSSKHQPSLRVEGESSLPMAELNFFWVFNTRQLGLGTYELDRTSSFSEEKGNIYDQD